MAAKCSIRFTRVSLTGLQAMRLHNQRRLGDLSHCDPSRKHLNRVMVGSDEIESDALRHVSDNGAVIRPNVAEPFVTGLCTASPEYFRAPGQGEGEWDPVRTEAYFDTTLRYLQERFGNDLVHVSLDFDESTPHLDFVVAPLHRYTTKRGKERVEVSPRQLFPGEKSWVIEQDRYAAALAHLGIERGARGNGAVHEDPQAYKRRLARGG